MHPLQGAVYCFQIGVDRIYVSARFCSLFRLVFSVVKTPGPCPCYIALIDISLVGRSGLSSASDDNPDRFPTPTPFHPNRPIKCNDLYNLQITREMQRFGVLEMYDT